VKEGGVEIASFIPSSGCDPEIFVRGGDGKIMPAFVFLTDKKHAQEVNGTYSPYWDGFQAEYTTPAQSCLMVLHDYIRQGLNAVLQAARAKYPKAQLTIENTVQIPESMLTEADDKYVQFGCSPSLNAYDDSPAIPGDARTFPWRFAGGHMHTGVGRIGKGTARAIVKACDGIVGVASVGMFAGIDTPVRRATYGRAGEYRLPKHGLEYRVLSNAHLCHPAVSHLTFELFRLSVRAGIAGVYPYLWDAKEEEVRDCVNMCDVTKAREIIKRNEKGLMWLLQKRGWINNPHDRYWHRNIGAWIFKVIYEGVSSIVDPTKIEENWYLIPSSNAAKKWQSNSIGVNCTWNSIVSNLPEPVPSAKA